MNDKPGQSRAVSIGSWVFMALMLICAIALAVRVLTSRGHWGAIFADMGTQLPVITTWVFSPYFLVPVYVLMVIGVAKELLVKNRVVTLILNGALLVCLMLYGWLYEVAITMPLMGMLESLQE